MFTTNKIPLSDLKIVSKLLQDYLNGSEEIKHLYQYKPDITSFKQVIKDKQEQSVDRELLAAILKEQYQNVDTGSKVLANIELLKDKNTFTVCTAHQLNMLTGPLYVIFKIISAINLAERLKSHYPDYNFVPVYFLGSEDHDFEEINHLHLFKKKMVWQSDQKGSTGKFNLQNFDQFINEVEQVLANSENIKPLFASIKDIISSSNTLSEFTFKFINELFKDKGLVILEADHKAFKRSFLEQMKKEITENTSYNRSKRNIQFLDENYKVQANPREINLFYVDENDRNRILSENSKYQINNSKITFTNDEIIQEMDAHPEKFSPNVILRPVYQEFILPNLAYIGGGGEIAYWLELKEVFEAFQVNFPMLLHRDAAFFLTKKDNKRWSDFGFSYQQLFHNEDELLRNYIKSKNTEQIDFSVEKESLNTIKDSLLNKALTIDQNLIKSIEGEFKKIENSFDNLNSKFIRALKRNDETSTQQINSIIAKIFPEGKFQERYTNFLEIYSSYGNDFFEVVFNTFDCLDADLKIIIEE